MRMTIGSVLTENGRKVGEVMKDDIRKQTGIIIRKNGYYLVGKVVFSTDLRWSTSPYEAWRTRDREKAAEIARKTGGVMMLFNPIVNQLRIL